MNKYKKLLIISLVINIVIISTLGLFIYKKGGVSYITSKFNKKEINAVNVQRESLFEELTISNNDIVFLGDSITQRCEWAELLNNTMIKNRGIDGDTTSDILNRIDYISKSQPKKIFIMIGTNDFVHNQPQEMIINNYKGIVDNIKENSPNTQIYIQSVLPTRDDKNNKKIVELNSKLKAFTQNSNCTYIDIHDKMKDEQGRLKDDLSKDGIHLMAKGYNIWADIIIKYVNN